MQNQENIDTAMLAERLRTLFLLCDLPQEEMDQPMLLKDNLRSGPFRSSDLQYFLAMLDRRTQLAIENLKAEKVNSWNAQQNEQYIEQLEQQLIEQRNCSYQLKMQLAELSQQQQDSQEEETLEAAFRQPDDSREQWWIQEMISFRDRLQQKGDWVENLPQEQQEAADKLIKTQLQETGLLLEQRGVAILDGAGPFQKEYQTVMMTQPVEDPAYDQQVAQTVRPGYCWREEVIRAQEVVLYVKEETPCL